jgi:RNA polymerase sigma factor (sigma-70 family)
MISGQRRQSTTAGRSRQIAPEGALATTAMTDHHRTSRARFEMAESLDDPNPENAAAEAPAAAADRAGHGDDRHASGAACVRAFREQFDFVCGCVRRYGGRGADVDDLVQDVFVAMWRRWPDFDGSRPLRPWLAGIAFRVARSHVRRRRSVGPRIGPPTAGGDPHHHDETIDVPDQAHDHHQRANADDARALVLEALHQLPERHRLPLVMHDLDELSVGEIAGLLQLPPATVYTRVRRARLAFAKVVTALQAPSDQQPAPDRVAGGGERKPGAITPPRFTPAALLALEREPAPAPPEARQRACDFARETVEHPYPPLDPMSQVPQAASGSARALTAIAIGVGALGLLGLVADRSAREARPPRDLRSATSVGADPSVPANLGPRASSDRARVPALHAVTEILPERKQASAATLATGLTGYWPMNDEPGAKVIKDVSGAGREWLDHEVATGPPGSIDGVQGRALALDRKAWLECPQPPVVRESRISLTVAAWVKRSSLHAPAAVVTRQIGDGFQDQFFFGFGPDNLRVVSHAWHGWAQMVAPALSRAWVHTAFTRDRDGTTRLFLDGNEVSHTQGGSMGKGPITAPITIGAGRYDETENVRQLLDGAVDEVAIWNRTLAPEEISALAAGVRPAPALAAR